MSDRPTPPAVGEQAAGRRNVPEYKEIGKLNGSWSVSFQAGRGAPESIELPQLKSLSEHDDFGVKHFSGTATYRKTFSLAEVLSNRSMAESRGNRLYLSLGQVANLAEVMLNEENCGVVWKPPFIVDVTDALKEGRNTIEVKVTNTWKNRLIGDASVPAEKRVGWTLSAGLSFKPDTLLEPAGLIRPVAVPATTEGIGSKSAIAGPPDGADE